MHTHRDAGLPLQVTLGHSVSRRQALVCGELRERGGEGAPRAGEALPLAGPMSSVPGSLGSVGPTDGVASKQQEFISHSSGGCQVQDQV